MKRPEKKRVVSLRPVEWQLGRSSGRQTPDVRPARLSEAAANEQWQHQGRPASPPGTLADGLGSETIYETLKDQLVPKVCLQFVWERIDGQTAEGNGEGRSRCSRVRVRRVAVPKNIVTKHYLTPDPFLFTHRHT